MKRSAGTIAILLAVLSVGTRPDLASSSPDTSLTTVILVRHAEKNPHPAGGDAGLSDKGFRRAHELARVLKEAGVQAIYSSPFGRAVRTAEPLARLLSDSVRIYDPQDLHGLAERIRARHRGQTVLVVGHSDTVPETIQHLCGLRLPDSEVIEYDRIYVLDLHADGSHRLFRLRYGAAPPGSQP